MFLALLRTQWRWCRTIILPGAVLLAAVPFLMLRDVTAAMIPMEVMAVVRAWSPLFPGLAALLGLLVALATWAPDRRGQHIHALTLPVARWRYILFRFGGGILLLGIPILAFALAAWLAVQWTPIPDGLAAYPWSLAFRFALGTSLAFAIFFAILSGTPRTAAIILGVLVAVAACDIVLKLFLPQTGLANDLLGVLLTGPGPLALFAGRWMLIDV